MSVPVAGANCPSKETLTAFMGGHLEIAVRRGVVEHMANCADCRIAISNASEWQAGSRGIAGPTRHSTTAKAVIWVTAIAACALVAVIGSMVRRHGDTRARAIAKAAGTMPVRQIVPRLTGDFEYRRFSSIRGGAVTASAHAVPFFNLEAIAAQTIAAAASSNSVDDLHAAGQLHLLTRGYMQAVMAMEQALRVQTGVEDPVRAVAASRDAALLTDLSAAYAVRGEATRNATDLFAAVDAGVAAWKILRTPETAWNRAFALEKLGLREDAQEAWREYLQLDSDSLWAAEARTYLQALLGSTDVQKWERLKQESAIARLDRSALQAAAASYPQYARAYAEEEVLPAWGTARIAGDDVLAARHLGTAAAIAAGIAANGDLLLQESVEAIRNAGAIDVAILAKAHAAYGAACKEAGDGHYANAAALFESASTLFENAGSPFASFGRFQIAVCSYRQNDYAVTAGLLDSLEQRVPAKYRSLNGRLLWMRGLTTEQLGDPTGAFDRYEAGLSTFSALGEKDNAAALLTLMAETLHRSGEDAAALQHHLRSIETIGRTGSSIRRHQVLFEAAFASIERHRLNVAEVLLDRALVTNRTAAAPNNACVALVWRGVIQSMRGDELRAAADVREAERFCNAIPDAKVRERIMANFTLAALAARRATVPRPVADTTKAITFFDASGSHLWLPQLLAERAQAYRDDGRLALAESDLRRGIAEVEAAEARARYASSINGVAIASLYESMIAICVEQRRMHDALAYAERASLRTVSALFGGRRQQQSAERAGEAAEAGSAAARVQALLPPDAVVANFFQLPDRLLIWTIRSHEVHLHEVRVSATAFGELAQRLSTDPQGAPTWPAKDVAAEVSRLVLGSWIGEVRENETVIVAGEAAVRELPLAALTHPAGGYLVQHVALATSTTLSRLASALISDAARRHEPKRLLVAASTPDPDEFPGLLPLPESEKEIRISSRMYRPAVVMTGEAATKQAFLAESSSATLVQFAGHAVTNARAPLFSALIFSAGQRAGSADDTLYMHEVSASTFPAARLVVLTACGTAQQLQPNVSFAAALVEQQVPSVLSSIWDADDRAAAVFGTNFHSAMRRGASRAGALREAQLSMARSSDPSISQPAAWAGYQLLGAFGPTME
jgi:CHAT domain-containing protein/tetratricopeptide (TPR) repeat protein